MGKSQVGKNQPKRVNWSDLKAEISQLEQRELIGLIADLYRLSKQNQTFLQLRFAQLADPLEPFKAIIQACLCPDVMANKPIQIAKAKQAISDYCKAVDDPLGEAELMTFFVEQGTDLTLTYGDINAGFYDAMILMFGRAVDKVISLPQAQQRPFRERLETIITAASRIGWGYPDGLRDHHRRGFAGEGH